MKTIYSDLIPMTMVWSRARACLALLRPVFSITLIYIFLLTHTDASAKTGELPPPMSCLSYVQLSLPQSGSVELGPQLFLAGDYPDYSIFTVDIAGPLGNVVGCDEIGQSLMVSIIDDQGNSCWSNLTIEDKSWPVIQCEDLEIPCNQDISEEDYDFFINVEDNCTPEENLNIYYNEYITDLDCDPDYVYRIDRTWFVSDQYGNQSSCSHAVYFTRLDVGDTDFPDDITVSCVETDLDPSNTGYPTIDGLEIPGICEIVTWKSDLEIPLPCEGEYKVMRTWTVMDWCFGQSEMETHEILVEDKTPPQISCPVDVTISTDQDVCTATYEIPQISASDLCSDDENIVISVRVNGIFGFQPGEEATLQLGENLISYTATDACGNSIDCLHKVFVEDLVAPTLDCGSVIQIPLMDNDSVTVAANAFQFYIFDNCELSDVQIRKLEDTCGHPDDLVFGDEVTFCCEDATGTVSVELLVYDVFNNANSCIFQVDVKDSVDPEVSCQDITIQLNDQGTYDLDPVLIIDEAMDNCGLQDTTVSINILDCSHVGDTPVDLVVTDLGGNTASCEAIVTVQDTTAPVALCQDVTIELDETGIATLDPEAVDNMSSDACGIDSYSLDIQNFNCNDQNEANPVVLTVTDVNGNISTCDANVTVLDNLPPECMAQDITVILDENGMLDVLPEQVDNGSTDNCGQSIELSLDIDSFDCTNLGDNVVVLTVTDEGDNSSSCTATITVQDTLAPVCMTQDVTLYVDEQGMASLGVMDVDNGSVDTCGMIVDMSLSQTNFDCSHVNMMNLVTLTLTDDYGNMSSCDANVTVLDTIDPVCNVMGIEIQLDEFGEAVITGDDLDMGSSDNCSIMSISSQPNTFFCNDIGANAVVVTVMDPSGNMASCNAVIVVHDLIPPEITCPADITLECTADLSDLDIYGVAMATDECGISSMNEEVVFPDNACNIGTIIRTFSVMDNDGNDNFCQQFITVNPPQNPMTEDDITWPPMMVDATMNCTTLDPDSLPGGPPTVDLSMVDCALVSIDYEDMTSSGGCACSEAVTRTWTVIDSCSLNSMNMDGIFTFVQTINVVDDEDPILNVPADIDTILAPMDCDAFLDIPEATAMDCNMVTITNNSPFADDSGVDASGTYEIGETIITFTATDCCGQMAMSTMTVVVQDTVPPAINCNTQFLAIIEMDDQVTIIPNDILLSASDNCTDSIDLNYSFSILDPNDNSLQFTCADIGPHLVDIYVTDEFNNVDSCQVTITVADPSSFCTMRNIDLGGLIITENGEFMEGVHMELRGYMQQDAISDQQGGFMFNELVMNESYSVSAAYDYDWANGISAWDMVLIQRHILGIEQLHSPYKMLAADVNNSKSITAGDILILQKLVLGIVENIANQQSWQFVNSQFEFFDVSNPFMDPIPDFVDFEHLDHDIYNANFIAIKTGDVNNTANVNSNPFSEIRSGIEFYLSTEDRLIRANETVEISMQLEQDLEFSALQLSLDLKDVEVLEISSGTGNILELDKDYVLEERGSNLKILSYDPVSIPMEKGDSFLKFKLRTNRSAKISELLSVSENLDFPSLVYDGSGREANLQLRFKDQFENQDIQHVQCMPNPFSDQIKIQFQLMNDAEVEMQILNVFGKRIQSAKIRMETGWNAVNIGAEELSGPGVYYIHIRTKSSETVLKVMHIR